MKKWIITAIVLAAIAAAVAFAFRASPLIPRSYPKSIALITNETSKKPLYFSEFMHYSYNDDEYSHDEDTEAQLAANRRLEQEICEILSRYKKRLSISPQRSFQGSYTWYIQAPNPPDGNNITALILINLGSRSDGFGYGYGEYRPFGDVRIGKLRYTVIDAERLAAELAELHSRVISGEFDG